MRKSKEKQRRAYGEEVRANRAISKAARRLDIRNGINALLMRFIRQIEAAEFDAWIAEGARDHDSEREAREEAAVLLEQDRILARGGVRWIREGFDGSTSPARALIAQGAENIARDWRRVDRNRWNWGDGDALALVRVERDLWELRYFHHLGSQVDLDTKNKFSGRLLPPGLDLATLRRVVTDWQEQNGTDPAMWGKFPQSGATAPL